LSRSTNGPQIEPFCGAAQSGAEAPAPTTSQADPIHSQPSPLSTHGDRELNGAHTTASHRDPVLAETVAQLRAYFDGRLGDFDLPVDFGPISDVAKAVLTTLSETVEAGTTITYGELPDASGTGIPARAVGGIMGLNPIPIIVPCHRVVAGDGLGGYSGGLPGHELEAKRRLLEWEDALPQALF